MTTSGLTWRKVAPNDIEAAVTVWQFGAIICETARVNAKLFVEIGTMHGGISSVILSRTDYVDDFKFITIEMLESEIDPRLTREILKRAPRAEQIVGDAFSPAIMERIANEIANAPGVTAIFCDGGDDSAGHDDRVRMMNTYAGMMRPGDIMFVHDWGRDPRSAVRDEHLQALVSQGFQLVDPEFWIESDVQVPCLRKL